MLRLSLVSFFIACFVVILQVATKVFPLWVYLLSLLIIGLSLSLSIWKFKYSNLSKYLLITVTAIIITIIYFVGTNFNVLPFGDTYSHYGLLQSTIDNGKLMTEFPPSTGDSPSASFSMYGEWPGTQLLGAVFALVTGMDALNAAIFLPIFYKLVAVLFILAIILRMRNDFKLDIDYYLVCIIVITSPWLLSPPTFFYQSLALCLWFGSIFTVYLIAQKNNRVEYLLLFLIFSCVLVVVHHTTPLMLLLYLLFLIVIFSIRRILSTQIKIPSLKSNIDTNILGKLSICLTIVFLSWWVFFSKGVWKYLPSRAQFLWDAITKGDFQIYMFQEYGASPPNIDYPLWGTLTLTIRDIVIVLSVITGFILVFLKLRTSRIYSFILYSLIFALFLTFIDVIFLKVASFREITMFMPFWVLCAALAFAFLQRYIKRYSVLFNSIIAIILVFTSLTGVWGNTYLPVFLYDPNVTAIQSGDHSLDWKYVSNTLGNKINYNRLFSIITDERYNASLIVPLDYWPKIKVAGLKGSEKPDKSVIFMFRNFNITQTYIEQALGERYDTEFSSSEFKNDLNNNANLIYTFNTTQVWITE